MKICWIVIISVCAFACTKQTPPREEPIVMASTELVPDETLALVKTYCYPCHNPQAPDHDHIIAPPLAAVKMRYTMTYKTRDKFISGMESFLLEPSVEKSVMPGAVQRFGVMPKGLSDPEKLRAIAAYIFDNKLEEPEWFAAHQKEMGGPQH